MGWTSQHREKGTTNEDFFLDNFNAGTRFHATGTVDGVFYAAVESPNNPGEVWGFVVLTTWAPNSHHNFTYKDMSESMGPCESKAPLAVLNALTETTSPFALEWRERVAQHHAQRKALHGLKAGDQVVLAERLNFTSGDSLDTFTIQRRSVGRGTQTRVALTNEGRHYKISHWQDRVVAVIRDGERTDTPLAVVRAENAYVRGVRELGFNRDHAEVLAGRYGESVVASGGVERAARVEFRGGGELLDLASFS